MDNRNNIKEMLTRKPNYQFIGIAELEAKPKSASGGAT